VPEKWNNEGYTEETKR
jgi:hypothetical protein